MTQQGKNAIDLVLAESLIELSAKKPIDKITIKRYGQGRVSAHVYIISGQVRADRVDYQNRAA